jgi:hypothetical protein
VEEEEEEEEAVVKVPVFNPFFFVIGVPVVRFY